MKSIKALVTKYNHFIKDKAREIREGGNALIFLVFLFLSTCFWILNALQKDDYTTEVSYPVRFINDDDQELVNGSLKRDLEIRIRGGGFKILPYHLRQQFSAQSIEISNLRRVTVDGVQGAYLNTDDYFKFIEGRLAVGIELLNISPDTLFVPLIDKKSKKVPVIISADLTLNQQCQLSGDMSVSPDSVLISGPADKVDTLKSIQTVNLVYEEVADTLVRNVQLEEIEGVAVDQKRVVVTIPVEPFTEARTKVAIDALNLPDSLVLKSFPSDVQVMYHIGLSRPLYEQGDFKATIDFSTIEIDNLPRRLKVRLDEYPDDIHNMTYQPIFVEYLLEKKD